MGKKIVQFGYVRVGRKFCLFFGTKMFGTRPVCTLFQQDLYADENDWTAKCPQCMGLFTGDRIVTREDFK